MPVLSFLDDASSIAYVSSPWPHRRWLLRVSSYIPHRTLALASVAGDAATRDLRTGMAPLIHAAPVGTMMYISGRFAGAFLVAALLLASIPLAHLVVPLLNTPPTEELVGPVRLTAMLQTYFVLLLPNAFVMTTFMFSLAMLLRHQMGGYAAIAVVFAATQAVVGIAEILERMELAMLLDLTGISTVNVMQRTWAPLELNEGLLSSSGNLLVNRFLWVSVAFAILAVVCRSYGFGGNAGAVRWWHRGPFRGHNPRFVDGTDPLDDTLAATRDATLVAPRSPRDFSASARLRQFWSITRDSTREVAPALWLAVPFLLIRVAAVLDALATMGGGTQVLPTTGLVLTPFDDMPPPVALALIMFPALVAGELIWRERDANIQAFTDTAPVPNSVRFAGKLLCLGLVFIALYALMLLAGVMAQLMSGWYVFEPTLYLQILGLELLDALVFALFALSIHVVVNHKHVGHLLVLLLLVGPSVAAETLGIEHPLLIVGFEPYWRYSPISGFEPFLGPLLWFDLYWAALVVLLAIVAWLFWVRGVERTAGERVRIARRRLTGWTARAAATTMLLAVFAAGFIFFNTNILNAYEPSAGALERQAQYERSYGQYRSAPHPTLTASKVHVEIYPRQGAADIRGTHQLVNRTSGPIDTIHVAVSPEVATGDIDFGQPARAAHLDDELGHRIYELDEPLTPGASLQMHWSVQHTTRGFSARGVSTAVVGNGSFISVPLWTPLIGYQPWREVSTPGVRRQLGLPERPTVPPLEDAAAISNPTSRTRIDLDITIGTATDQVAVGPGELRRTWEQDGRRYFQYVPGAPIGNEYAIFSADYATQQSRSGDVVLEVAHHPEHDHNVQRVLRSMEASLEQFTERFGPYPYKVLRFVEYPAAGGSLHAAAGSVWYQELFSLFDPENERRQIDMPFAVTAHEVAHQFQPFAARVEGQALLSESFAWYAALDVIEHEYGEDHLSRFLGYMREAYRNPRSRAATSLLRASDSFLAYRKGPLAMYALREYLGGDNVDLAWRRVIEEHGSGPPFATSLDLYRELQEVAPEPLQYLLVDLLENNTFWELQANGATAQQTAGGEWAVDIELTARKVVVDTEGRETAVAMDDLVEVGIFAAPQPGETRPRPLHLAMHRIRSGPQTVNITVSEQPVSAGIDPRYLLIDVATADNFAEVADSSSANSTGNDR